MKITTVTPALLILLVGIRVSSGSQVSQYDDAYESSEEGGYNEDSQDVSAVEDDMFREYIVHEERIHRFANLFLY